MKRPSHMMKAAITGALPLSKAPKAWLSFWAYKQADWVLQGVTKQERHERLDTIPEAVRALVKQEARRLHKMRIVKKL